MEKRSKNAVSGLCGIWLLHVSLWLSVVILICVAGVKRDRYILSNIMIFILPTVPGAFYIVVDNENATSFMKPTRKKRLQPAIATAGVVAGVFAAHASDITVFAAASLTDSLKRIASDYEKQTGNKVQLNFGASSTLARQIEEGAPADLFFSADEARMNELQGRGLLVNGTRETCLSNSLVVVVASDSKLNIHSAKDLANADVQHVALADPKAVPAGVYSREYLEKTGLWQTIEPKVVPAENVRAALAAVESGNVEAGMVYKTDAAISKKVRVACEVPPKDGPPISYPVAVLKESEHPDDAKAFEKFLEGPDAGQIFERYGFVVHR